MLTENYNLYFIAMVLPKEISNQVVEVQTDFAERFESRRSLKVMPHITLKAPFKLQSFMHNQLLSWFSDLTVEVPSFRLELENFDAFKNPKHPVIFIKPDPNDNLCSLQRVIIQKFYQHFDNLEISASEIIFTPHITVAYRDLQPQMFTKAWREYENKKFSGTFHVDNFNLLKHDGKVWNVIRQCDLKQPTNESLF